MPLLLLISHRWSVPVRSRRLFRHFVVVQTSHPQPVPFATTGLYSGQSCCSPTRICLAKSSSSLPLATRMRLSVPTSSLLLPKFIAVVLACALCAPTEVVLQFPKALFSLTWTVARTAEHWKLWWWERTQENALHSTTTASFQLFVVVL